MNKNHRPPNITDVLECVAVLDYRARTDWALNPNAERPSAEALALLERSTDGAEAALEVLHDGFGAIGAVMSASHVEPRTAGALGALLELMADLAQTLVNFGENTRCVVEKFETDETELTG